MSLTLLGVLPVSAFDVGLATGVLSIGVEVSKLQFDLGKFQGALTVQAQVMPATLPNPLTLPAQLATYLLDLTPMLNPATWVTASVDANFDLTADYGIISGQLALAQQFDATFSAGMNAGGLALWTYAGSASGFGPAFSANTAAGYGTVKATQHINAIVVVTENFENWGVFSATFNTGTSSSKKVSTTSERKLKFEGYFSGGELNTGVAELKGQLDLVLADLGARKANLEAQLNVSLGINLPSPDLLIDIALDFNLSDLIPNFTFQVDLVAQISVLSADIARLTAQIDALQLTLSAGGFAVWVYDGPVNALGPALESELFNGVPAGNGPDAAAYGLVVACETPAFWQSFGLIFGGSS